MSSIPPVEQSSAAGVTSLKHWAATDALQWLRPPRASDNKVRRGVLAARIGSNSYPGAAVLGVSAAWRTGIGMVRYVAPLGDVDTHSGLPSPAAAVLAARPETLFGAGTEVCDAWLLGSGTDAAKRSAEETEAIAQLHRGETPLVVDAGALDSVLLRGMNGAPAVLTPHLGEFRRLWDAAGMEPLPRPIGVEEINVSAAGGANAAVGVSAAVDVSTEVCPEAVVKLAKRLGVTILLKGSTSLIANPQGQVIYVGPATPWLATAGTGDVLAGILGALVARHSRAVLAVSETLAALAATAALVHDAAARLTSGDDSLTPESCTGAPITALDVANAVPAAIRQLR